MAQCPANCASVAQCPANCASVAQCPAVTLLQEQVNTLLEITPDIIAEVADLEFRSDALQFQLINQQNQIIKLQAAQPAPFPPPNPVVPYNQATCDATNFSDFNSRVGTWVAVDWGNLASATNACNQGPSSATCSAVCANYNLRCDPCATSRALSCTTPLFYALQQAGKSNEEILNNVRVLAGVTPPPPNAQLGPACTVIASSGPLTSTTTIGTNQAICGDGSSFDPIPTAHWPDLQNFVESTAPKYNDPATACDKPVREKTFACSGCPALVQTGSVCYCTT